MSLLSLRGLSKHFDGLTAVNGVDFNLPTGQVRALIGPNGAGKSTLVNLVCGRVAPSSGTIRFDGQDITRLPAHRRINLGIAYTFQITSVFGRLPVAENVALAARRRLGDEEMRQAIQAALARVGLAGRADQEAGDLAYGHQRLLEIAMGLVQAPKLLILDEPTQGLAESEVQAFITLIRDLASETTILLIEHNMDVVMQSADRITVLDQGAVLAEGTPKEIRTNKAVQDAYLGVA